jgi:hypothetical protein
MVLMTKRTADLFHSPGGTKETKEVCEKELPSDIQAIQQPCAFAMGEVTGLGKWLLWTTIALVMPKWKWRK